MKSIQSKILTAMIAGLLVITVAVSVIAVNMTHTILHKDADRILNNVAQKEAAYINDALGDIVHSAAIMESYSTAALDTPEQLRDPEFLEEYLQKTKKLFLKIALSNDRVEGFYMRFNPEFTSNTTGFYTLIKDDGSFQDMPVTNLAENSAIWYYDPVAAQAAIWLEPYNFPNYDHRLISYAAPIYVDDQLLGVVGFDIDFETLQNKVNNISVYEQGYAVLLDQDGKTEYAHEDRLKSTNPYTTASAELINGMKLELRADYKDIQKESRSMMTWIVLSFIVVLACSVIYVVIVTHKIVDPLKKLIKIAENLRDVDLVEWDQLPVNDKDEIGILSNALRATYQKSRDYFSYINELAYRDSLTGIKNHTAYAEETTRLNHEIISGEPKFGVLVADINNLKSTNDRFGHDAGDELIRQTARILKDSFQTSSIFRIGGDEFVVILTGIACEEYREALERFDEASTTGDGRTQPMIARGVAFFEPGMDNLYQDVFSRADRAMYQNKKETKSVQV